MNGPRMFSAEAIRSAFYHATTNMRAMILLGINGGLGNTDLGELPINAIDLEGGGINYPRPKTGMDRRFPLWAETIAAISKVLEERREPKDAADAPLLFIGRRGESYIGNHKGYRVTQEAARAFKKAGLESRTFYDLRRTFQTIAESSRDLVAVQYIMGHAPESGDMSAIYRQRVGDERLKAVVSCVHTWLFAVRKDKSLRGEARRTDARSVARRTDDR